MFEPQGALLCAVPLMISDKVPEPAKLPDIKPWKPRFENVASQEHRDCLDIAYQICTAIAERYPGYIKQLDHLPSSDVLWAEKAMLGVERSSHIIDIGQVASTDYILRVIRQDRIGQSRVTIDPDPEMISMVSIGEVQVQIEPKSDMASLHQPLYEAIVTLAKYEDEENIGPLEIIGIIPMARKTTHVGQDGLTMSATGADESHIPRHVVSVKKIAFSSDPELGDYALRAIKEVLSAALSALRNAR